ncbi:MAG: metallopeptidase TldD-related protein [Candidatus Izemoplasmatales bacterium]|nr:metallopeptidase TldD-related protein [Candidatus Izemoplasmatales bacterium]
MIKLIEKCLKEYSEISDWLITETVTDSSQAFYVMQKLETTRKTLTKEYTIALYHRFMENDNEYVGSSSFKISHKLRKSDLKKLIEEALFAATFVKNKAYPLVQGDKKRSWKEKTIEIDPFELMDQIASIYNFESTTNKKFNAMELFYTKSIVHIVNSLNVNLKKTTNAVFIEAIPSYDGDIQKVELYKHFNYKNIDLSQIKQDAKNALKEVEARYYAISLKNVSKIDVIIKDQEVEQFFENLIEDYSYVSIYKKSTDKVIGDPIQKDIVGEKLDISYIPSSKANAFDADGVLLSPVQVIKQGILMNYYGSNQYAQYLGIKPTGYLDKINVNKGKSSLSSMTKKPHLEILALSGIQIDMYTSYIGGEVRLAQYFDGTKYIPVSGFSFSGNIDKCLSNLILSKETVSLEHYSGPKYIKLLQMEIV